MSDRIVTTEVMILHAYLDGNDAEVSRLLGTMSYNEVLKYALTLDGLTNKIDYYLIDILNKGQDQKDEAAVAKLRHDAEDVARLIREINGDD